jgi:RimJ/RimL family protein N-acetyltransferase
MTSQGSPKPGKVVKRFQRNGMDVTFRYPKWKDLPHAMEYINSLVEERAPIGMQKKVDLKKEKEWLSGVFRKMRKCDAVTLTVEINGMYAGTASISRNSLDANRHVCKVGIGLGKRFRGKGIGTELLETLVQQARDVLKCRIVELSYYEHNAIGKRVYEKCGFKEAGKIPKGCNFYGKYYDEIIMVRNI